MTADITGHTTPRGSGIKRNEMEKRLKKLEDQMNWLVARYAEAGDNPKIEKHDIQIACLRKQVLDLEGKKSYTEQAREYAKDRQVNLRWEEGDNDA